MFTNAIVFDEMDGLEKRSITATGATRQAFHFRENVEVTHTRARAAECGGAGIYSEDGSRVTYGDVIFYAVGREVIADGEIRKVEPASPAA